MGRKTWNNMHDASDFIAKLMTTNKIESLYKCIRIEHPWEFDNLRDAAVTMPALEEVCKKIEASAKHGCMKCSCIVDDRTYAIPNRLRKAHFAYTVEPIKRTFADWLFGQYRYRLTVYWHETGCTNDTPAFQMKALALSAKLPYELRRAIEHRWPYACVPLLDDAAVKCIKERGFNYELQHTPYCTMCIVDLTKPNFVPNIEN